MGWEAIRESTSWNQANGSTFTSSQEATKLRSTAAVLPPRSLPKNVQLLRLCTRAHKRNYAQPGIMFSWQAEGAALRRPSLPNCA